MSRPHTPAVLAALADIDAGMTAYAAAKKHAVQQSSLSRALKRRSNLCPCCGQPVKLDFPYSNQGQLIDDIGRLKGEIAEYEALCDQLGEALHAASYALTYDVPKVEVAIAAWREFSPQNSNVAKVTK